MRRAVAETWAQDVINRANPEGQLPVNVPELELNFVALVSAAMHQLSNGGDQHQPEGWKHLLPDSEEEFMDVLEMANVPHAKDGLFVDEKPSAPLGDETDAEDFAIWEDDDVAEEQEQADEVAEEPVFAYDGPPHHVEEEPRPEEPPTHACANGSLFAWSTCRRVHAASAHVPDDYHRTRSTDGVRRFSASVRRRSSPRRRGERATNCVIVAVTSSFVASRSEIFFNCFLHRS